GAGVVSSGSELDGVVSSGTVLVVVVVEVVMVVDEVVVVVVDVVVVDVVVDVVVVVTGCFGRQNWMFEMSGVFLPLPPGLSPLLSNEPRSCGGFRSMALCPAPPLSRITDTRCVGRHLPPLAFASEIVTTLSLPRGSTKRYLAFFPEPLYSNLARSLVPSGHRGCGVAAVVCSMPTPRTTAPTSIVASPARKGLTRVWVVGSDIWKGLRWCDGAGSDRRTHPLIGTAEAGMRLTGADGRRGDRPDHGPPGTPGAGAHPSIGSTWVKVVAPGSSAARSRSRRSARSCPWRTDQSAGTRTVT